MACELSRSGPIVICDNLERKCNIAAVLCTCSSIDCAALLLVRDWAPGRRYPKDASIFHEAKMRGEAKAFWSSRCHFVASAAEVEALLPDEKVVFGVDTTPGAIDLFTNLPCSPLRAARSCFIFGNESEGISKSLLGLCDRFIYIPSPGHMKSLNASLSAVVVLFEWLRQSTHSDGSQSLLHQILPIASDSSEVAVHNGYETRACFEFFSDRLPEKSLPHEGSGPFVICDNLPSSIRGGIGAMIRLCCNMDCAELLLVHDANRDLPKESSMLRASAQGQGFWKAGRGRFVAVEELEGFLPAERVVYGVQAAPGSVDVFEEGLFTRHETRKPCFVFSGSPEGMSEPLLSLCDAFVHVPCPGQVKSLHVSHSAAVVLFQWLRQQTGVLGT